LYNNTTAGKNTAIGQEAMVVNTVGSENVAVGYQVLYANTTGTMNTAIGAYALDNNTTGVENTAVGWQALTSNTVGYYNTSVGRSAFGSVTTGLRNTAIGWAAGNALITGNDNVTIGYGADSTSSSANGEFTLGNASITNLRCNDTTISSLSDGRDKTDVVDNPYGLDFINAIKPRQFKWATRDGNVKDGETRLGFIAQELLEAADGNNDVLDLVYESNPDRLEAKYGNLIPVLTKAIQELSAENKALAARLSALESN
jgi:hypothetical protein